MIKINIFRGDLSDISAKKASLVTPRDALPGKVWFKPYARCKRPYLALQLMSSSSMLHPVNN